MFEVMVSVIFVNEKEIKTKISFNFANENEIKAKNILRNETK